MQAYNQQQKAIDSIDSQIQEIYANDGDPTDLNEFKAEEIEKAKRDLDTIKAKLETENANFQRAGQPVRQTLWPSSVPQNTIQAFNMGFATLDAAQELKHAQYKLIVQPYNINSIKSLIRDTEKALETAKKSYQAAAKIEQRDLEATLQSFRIAESTFKAANTLILAALDTLTIIKTINKTRPS